MKGGEKMAKRRIRLNNSKASREAVQDLYERFLMGEKITIKQVVDDYFAPRETYAYLQARMKATRWMQLLKKRYKKNEGVWFGCVDDRGHYGIPETQAEYRYPMTRYYTFTKGVLQRAQDLNHVAQVKGILQSTQERVLLPRAVENG